MSFSGISYYRFHAEISEEKKNEAAHQHMKVLKKRNRQRRD